MTSPHHRSPAVEGVTVPTSTARPRSAHWWIRGGRPAWALPAHAGVTILAAVLYTWEPVALGGLRQQLLHRGRPSRPRSAWKAFFFGSIDPGNFITVDKPPAALWVQAISGRIFGFLSSWFDAPGARGPGRSGLGG